MTSDTEEVQKLIDKWGDDFSAKGAHDARHDPGPIATEPAISGGWPLPSRNGRRWWDYEPPQWFRRAVEVGIMVFAGSLGGYLAGYIAGISGRPFP